MAHKRILRTENIGIDFIERIASQVVIAVAGCRRKMRFAYAVIGKRFHNAPLVYLCRVVNTRELLLKSVFGKLRKVYNAVGQAESFSHKFIFFDCFSAFIHSNSYPFFNLYAAYAAQAILYHGLAKLVKYSDFYPRIE